ncbi:hypothetical protein C6P40_001269 [Pichia californica]|uniref:Uncharacterized protein n=1 Tax=Pichia californica TaxID=460514 RepID=A0A9P7BDK4_9ASCO|nr:hypothetical protein C6P42_001327 [[Candida] californica]KAG0688217.1 hypothetical protein C6P40_001269 [[Candida] californica]
MDDKWKILEKRILRLEVNVGASVKGGDLNAEDILKQLGRIRHELHKYKPLETLINKLQDCNVDYNQYAHMDNFDRLQAKEVVLESYESLVSCVSKIEIVIDQYDTFFNKFMEIHLNISNSDVYDHKNLLETYERIQSKYTNVITRLICLLEQRMLLKYKQEELMISINSELS